MREAGNLAFPHFTALRAQRLLGHSAFRFAPAAAAGAMAGGHLQSAGKGVIVFIAVLAASWMLERDRYPIQLMPLAGFAIRACGSGPWRRAGAGHPCAGRATGSDPGDGLVPVVGAWIVTAFAAWSKSRFEASRRVRVAVIGSAGLARGLDEELRSAGIRRLRSRRAGSPAIVRSPIAARADRAASARWSRYARSSTAIRSTCSSTAARQRGRRRPPALAPRGLRAGRGQLPGPAGAADRGQPALRGAARPRAAGPVQLGLVPVPAASALPGRLAGLQARLRPRRRLPDDADRWLPSWRPSRSRSS